MQTLMGKGAVVTGAASGIGKRSRRRSSMQMPPLGAGKMCRARALLTTGDLPKRLSPHAALYPSRPIRAADGSHSCASVSYLSALDADIGVSLIPCSRVLFEWGVSAMRRGDLCRAEEVFAELGAILPEHVRGRRHRAALAQARRQLRGAA
jgi:hypothetical protein